MVWPANTATISRPSPGSPLISASSSGKTRVKTSWNEIFARLGKATTVPRLACEREPVKDEIDSSNLKFPPPHGESQASRREKSGEIVSPNAPGGALLEKRAL